jgi:hypothetical protein
MRKAPLLIPLALLILPAVASAAAPRTFQELVNLLVTYMNAAVAVLIVLALVYYLYGIATAIAKSKDKGTEALRTRFLYGVLILFVLVSVWGILQLLQNSLFGTDQFNGGGSAPSGQQGGSFTPTDTFE